MSKASKILVFGANSQIGRFLVPALLDKGLRVSGVSRYSSKLLAIRPAFERPNYSFNLGDITYPTCVNDIIKSTRPDIIVNLVAMSSPIDCYKSKRIALETNVTGVLNILESIKNTSPDSIFINFGSINEKLESRKHEFYSATKSAARGLVEAYRKYENVKAIQLYIGMNTSEYGIDINVEASKVAKAFKKNVNAIKSGRGFIVPEIRNVDSKRHWAYSGDVAEFVSQICSNIQDDNYIHYEPHEIIGEEHSLDDFIKAASYACEVVYVKTETGYSIPFKDEMYEILKLSPEQSVSDSKLESNTPIVLNRTPFSDMVSKIISACPI